MHIEYFLLLKCNNIAETAEDYTLSRRESVLLTKRNLSLLDTRLL